MLDDMAGAGFRTDSFTLCLTDGFWPKAADRLPILVDNRFRHVLAFYALMTDWACTARPPHSPPRWRPSTSSW